MRRNQPNKADIVRSIISAASAYNQDLVGKTFLYAFDGRYIEVLFKTQNFCHLTGVETSSSARPFYRDALRGRLHPGQIWFTSRHPYNLCVLKTGHIQNLRAMTNSRVVILENTATDTITYEFRLTELKFTLCLGKDTDADGNLKSGYYVVKSLRDGDCLNRSGNHHRCDFIFSKQTDERLYNTLCYADGMMGVDALSDEVKSKLSPDFFRTESGNR